VEEIQRRDIVTEYYYTIFYEGQFIYLIEGHLESPGCYVGYSGRGVMPISSDRFRGLCSQFTLGGRWYPGEFDYIVSPRTLF